jgi:signal transduction histidine kinase
LHEDPEVTAEPLPGPSAERLEAELGRLGKTLAVGQFAPGVIHEINNPLFAILGLLEFLLAESQPGSKTHERLLLMQQSGLEIKNIVRAVIDFSREQHDERLEWPLEDLAREALQLFRRTSVARDIDVELEVGPGLLSVVGNRNALKVVLLNLLTNSQQAMPHGGTVRVALARSDDTVVAAVTDSGPGVVPEAAEALFEPFFTTRSAQGAVGLGLTIARALARQEGGELTYEPSDGHGARFVLRLPAAGSSA